MKQQRPFIALLMLIIMGVSTSQLQAQTPAPDSDILSLVSAFEVEGCGILEVSKEMFEILSQDDRATEEIKATFSQIEHLIYLNCFDASNNKEKKEFDITKQFKSKANDYHFKLLMRSETGISSNLFYKRKNGDNNEYLLVTNTTIQYLSTKLNIMSIRDLKDIMDLAGDAGDL